MKIMMRARRSLGVVGKRDLKHVSLLMLLATGSAELMAMEGRIKVAMPEQNSNEMFDLGGRDSKLQFMKENAQETAAIKQQIAAKQAANKAAFEKENPNLGLTEQLKPTEQKVEAINLKKGQPIPQPLFAQKKMDR